MMCRGGTQGRRRRRGRRRGATSLDRRRAEARGRAGTGGGGRTDGHDRTPRSSRRARAPPSKSDRSVARAACRRPLELLLGRSWSHPRTSSSIVTRLGRPMGGFVSSSTVASAERRAPSTGRSRLPRARPRRTSPGAASAGTSARSTSITRPESQSPQAEGDRGAEGHPVADRQPLRSPLDRGRADHDRRPPTGARRGRPPRAPVLVPHRVGERDGRCRGRPRAPFAPRSGYRERGQAAQ
jgi:hypothetical protein